MKGGKMKQKMSDREWKSVMDFFAKIFRKPSRLDSLPDKTLFRLCPERQAVLNTLSSK